MADNRRPATALKKRRRPVLEKLILAGELAEEKPYAWTDDHRYSSWHGGKGWYVDNPGRGWWTSLSSMAVRAVRVRDVRLALTVREIEQAEAKKAAENV